MPALDLPAVAPTTPLLRRMGALEAPTGVSVPEIDAAASVPPAAARYCPLCHQEARPTAETCVNCGTPLAGALNVAPVRRSRTGDRTRRVARLGTWASAAIAVVGILVTGPELAKTIWLPSYWSQHSTLLIGFVASIAILGMCFISLVRTAGFNPSQWDGLGAYGRFAYGLPAAPALVLLAVLGAYAAVFAAVFVIVGGIVVVGLHLFAGGQSEVRQDAAIERSVRDGVRKGIDDAR
jgi:hypothetical protein